MPYLIDQIRKQLSSAAREAFPEISSGDELEITQSTQPQFGDYQCNSAMKLAKLLNKPPRVIAQGIIDRLSTENSPFKKVEIAGPGFINLWLDLKFINQLINQQIHCEKLGISAPSKAERIIIDFSSPNIAKEMHVGHLRSTIIGDSLARLLEFLGYEVVRYNHLGDWGTAFGMLIAYIKEKNPQVLHGKATTDLSSLVQWYKAAKVCFDQDADFKQRSQQEVVTLQSGDLASLHAWEIICDISRKAYQEIYDLLDVKLIDRGESFYNPFLPQIVADLESKGLVTLSDGAKCIFIDGFKNREGDALPLMIQKSDGGYNYDTTDMATIWHRAQVDKADRLIYVTDAGQSTHFQMIFKAAEKAGYLDPQKIRCDHVPFGVVLGADGKKFKTRSGETEKLIDLINHAIAEAKRILYERKPELTEMPEQEVAKTAQILGINAIKYADLSCARIGDYHFSYERMLRFEGNTAAFLMYAYVRVAGIKRKINADISALLKQDTIQLEHPSEIDLGVHLLRFGEILDSVARDLLPNRLADYLFNLAEKFHAFFRDCRVEGSLEQSSRLLLCELTAQTLKKGMEILGLKTVERM